MSLVFKACLNSNPNRSGFSASLLIILGASSGFFNIFFSTAPPLVYLTTKGLLVLKIDDQRNLLVVKGSVPGKPGSIINIKPNNVVGKKGGEKS